MSAGLPGVGLSGVFFIISALVMLPCEIVQTIRGRSSWQRWSRVLRHLAIAITMIAGLQLVYVAVHLVIGELGAAHSNAQHAGGQTPVHHVVRLLPWAPV